MIAKENNSGKKRVLVVDDEPDISLILKMVLEDSGLEVHSFEDPISALNSFEVGLYDLLILDIKMPEMDGFELYHEIRKKDNKVKICFLTASEMYYKKLRNEEFCSLNKDMFIQKPIENEELIKEINKILSS
jgi:DNA-binding response OmpR family regulator